MQSTDESLGYQPLKIRPDKTSRYIGIIAVCVAVVICTLAVYTNRAFYHDDAFITLRYADNFLHGDGLVWNPGERVEGYSNFGFLMLIVVAGRLGIDLQSATRIINFAALLIMAVVLIRFAYRRRDSFAADPFGLMPAIIILTSFPLIVWSLGGLEGPLFSMWCLLGIMYVIKSRSSKHLALAGLFFAFAVLTRMDGLVFVGVALLYLLWASPGTRLKSAGIFLASFLVIYLPYFIWRVTYYGDLLPNTFYVKAGGLSWPQIGRGLSYVGHFAITPPYLLPAIVIMIAYVLYRRSFKWRIGYLLMSIGVYLAYITWVGGDHMYAFRFMLPVIAATALLIYAVIISIKAHPSKFITGLIYLIVLAAVSLQFLNHEINPRKMDNAATVGKAVGEYIEQNWPKGSLVALNTAGSTPYFAPDLRFLDMLGLNDRHIAHRRITSYQLYWQHVPGHSKGDGAYVLSRRPDYIILGPAAGGTASNPWFLSDLELSQSPEFLRDYAMHQVMLNAGDAGSERFVFTYYQRRASTP